MAEEKFKGGHVLSTGAVVMIGESPKQGLNLCLINPLLSPDDRPCISETNDERGRVTRMRISEEAAVSIMVLLREYVESKDGSTQA